MVFKAWGPICRACTLHLRASTITTFLKVTEWSIWRRFQNTIRIMSTQQEKGAGGLGESNHPHHFSTPVCHSQELHSYRRVTPRSTSKQSVLKQSVCQTPAWLVEEGLGCGEPGDRRASEKVAALILAACGLCSGPEEQDDHGNRPR